MKKTLVARIASFAFALQGLAVCALAQRPLVRELPAIEVLQRGTHIVQATFDTRIGEPITGVTLGGNLFKPENPLVFNFLAHDLAASTTQVGGLLKQPRSNFGPLWPGIQQDGWIPPDPTIAVGPEHVVMTTNMKIAFFLKDGTRVFLRWLGNQEPQGFFAPIGAGGFTFDPKVMYDRNSGRFIVVVLERYTGPNRSFIDIAISDDSDPNGTWYLYRTDSRVVFMGQDYWADYPGLGVDQNAIYVTANMFGFVGGYRGVLFRGIPIANILNGGTLTFFDFFDTAAVSVQCAQSYGTPNAEFFASVGGTNALRIHAIQNPLGTPVLNSLLVSVPPFFLPASGAPQQGTSATIDTLDGRIMNAAWRSGKLITTHAVRPDAVTANTISRWYEFATGTWPQSGAVTLLQSGNVDGGPAKYMLFPAVGFNDFNDIGMVTGRSSATEFAGVYTTGRRTVDPQGTMGALSLAKMGSAGYTGGRWGDYFGIQTDPADGLTFWGVGEFADSPSVWKTWVASWRVAVYRNLNVTANAGGVSGVSGITVNVTPDGRGNGAGVTPFVRTYYDAAHVTLEAADFFSRGRFTFWKVDGVAQPAGQRTITVAMNAERTVEAVYVVRRYP